MADGVQLNRAIAMGISDYFSINIFFIIFRETLECVIIVSVLLAFLEQNSGKRIQSSEDSETSSQVSNSVLLKKLRLQVWFGAFCGIVSCLVIGGLFILFFYLVNIDLWSKSEHYWEGVFSVVASVIISIMGVGMLRLGKLEKKWHLKLSNVFTMASKTQEQLERSVIIHHSRSSRFSSAKFAIYKIHRKVKQFGSKHMLFILPFVTTLRECLESILFIGGIGVTEESSTYLFSVIFGILVGTAIGLFIYRSGTNSVSSQKFMIYSTSLLYILSAGLMSKGVWQFELQRFIDKCGGLDVSEVGSGPGSYDVDNSVWHVNCCNGEADGPWMIVTAILGWTNSATYGSVTSYIIYWLVIILAMNTLKFESKNGYLPLIPYKWQLKKIRKNYLFLSNMDTTLPSPTRVSHESTDDSHTGLLA